MNSASARLEDLVRTYLRSRYKILFFTLLLTFVCFPVLHSLKLSGRLVELFLAASLLAAILPVNAVRTRPSLLVAMALAWVMRPVSDWLDYRLLSAMTLGIWVLIGLLAAAAALRFAMSATQVDAEHLYAALSAYLLAGIYLGLLFWIFEQLSPGAFTVTGQFSQASAIYFSFVTLATLGYGDIAPRADLARGLAVIEGVGGQLFLAVLVARLVSLYAKPGNQSN